MPQSFISENCDIRICLITKLIGQGVFSDVEMMIRMKKVVLLFALTMKSYGYDITRLYQLLKHFT